MFSMISRIIQWIGRHFMGMLFLLIVLVVFMPKEKPTNPANLQEIKLSGPIMGSDKVLKQIEEARTNSRIKGVLFTVNSPGGAVPPSVEISYAIRRLALSKPVIAYASGIMASGSYYSALYANQIIANPGSIIGSIGVIMESANVQELMQKIGIEPQVIKEGAYKEAGTPTRAWTREERAELQQLTKDTYNLFVGDVSQARGLDPKDAKIYADAHIFLAKRAKEVGLIDEVGVKSDAKEALLKLSGVKKPIWKKRDKFESLLEEIAQEASALVQGQFYGLKSSIW
jgi:protease-4